MPLRRRNVCLPLLFTLLFAFPEIHSAAEPADLVVLEATILTIDHPARAAALAVRDGKFTAVGSEEEVRELIGDTTVVWRLPGRTIVPGFNDAHLHPAPEYPPEAPYAKVPLGPGEVDSIEALIAALKRKAELTPRGAWVRGTGYQETKLGRHPTRRDLDRASTEHPIYIEHSSKHLAVCNSHALRLAGIDRSSADPPGGVFERDPQGEPTGLLRETAMAAVRSKGPALPAPTRREELLGWEKCLRRYAAAGITSVQIAGTDTQTLQLVRELRGQGRLPVRVYAMLRAAELEKLAEWKQAGRLGDAWVKLGGVKLFHGNSLSGQTAWLHEPYAHRDDYYGVPPARSQASLNRLILRIHQAGLQACVHANGDREIDMVLDAFEHALERQPRSDHRHRIEHCSIVNEKILARIRTLGVVLAPHSYIHEHGDKMEAHGEHRWNMMHPNGSAVELGIPVAGNSDDPVSPALPLLRVQSMVTRRSAEGKVYGPRQRVSVEAALRIWTLGSAYASFDERDKGSITVGKQADFTILGSDPTHVPPEHLGEIAVERTVVAGMVTHPHP